MFEHELVEGPGSNRGHAATDRGHDADHAQVGDAVRAGRPDMLGPRGMMHLQRAVGNAGAAALVQRQDDEQSPVHDVIRSSGSPLDTRTRETMEARFGHDFTGVQVHTDAKAAASAQSVQAQAYTVGDHIVFNEGKYQPGTADGDHRLAHELTHVVQQRSGPVDGSPAGGGINLSDPSDRFEREAEATATEVMSGAPSAAGPAPAPAATAGVQRQEEDPTAQEMPLQRTAEQEGQEEQTEDAPTVAPMLQRDAAPPEEEAAEE